MDHLKEGIHAHIDRVDGSVTLRDFAIEEGILMAFGEEHYLPAFARFLEWVEDGAKEIRAEVSRCGYRMLFARFGYALDKGVMIKRPGDTSLEERAKKAAVTFEATWGSAFPADSMVAMADGSTKAMSELEVGEEVKIGGVVMKIRRARQRALVRIDDHLYGATSSIWHDGYWIRANTHPDASPARDDEGVETYSVATVNRRLEVNGRLFGDIFETDTHLNDLLDFQSQAIAIMNEMMDDEEKAGWSTRIWRREEIDLIRPWWKGMAAAGYGDWGDGPSANELSRLGFMAELNGQPVACVFVFCSPSDAYAAIYSPMCDVSRSYHACFRGLALAARAAAHHCRDLGIEEVVSFIHTPAVVKSFEMAGFKEDPVEYNNIYISDKVIPWLEP